MFKDKDFRKSILASVIASILFIIFFQPILTFFWNICRILSIKFYENYIDSVYLNAALGQRNWIDLILLGSLALAICLSAFAAITSVNSKIGQLSSEELTPQKQTPEKKVYKLEESLKRIKKIRIILYVLSPFLMLTTLLIVVDSFVDLQLNTSFNQKINAIAPYITDQEEKILKSHWALMESRQDYELVNKNFQELAIKYKAKLPKDLLY